MAYSVRTLLLLTLVIAFTIALAPNSLAVLVFAVMCFPLALVALRFRQIRERLGRFGLCVLGLLATSMAYIALAGPWLMYTTYHGCATPFYGVPTPICDALTPLAVNVVHPIMDPATDLLLMITIDDDYDPALATSFSNFDPTGWYTCEWMRYGMLLLTDEPPF